jgi:DNA-binding NarL/FixJ family response regulator
MALFAETLGAFLANLDPPWRVSTATSVPQALAIASTADDLEAALLDLRMPTMDGFDALRLLRNVRPALPLVVISGDADATTVGQARAAGARGFIPKTLRARQMIDTLRAILAGEMIFLAKDDVEGEPLSTPRATPSRAAALSQREREILEHAAQGRSNKQIAAALRIQTGTVALHLSKIYRKLGASNRVQAVRMALGIDHGRGS